MEHAENIRTLAELCSARSTMDENEPIAEFDVKVFMEEDDQGNQFPGKMAVIYEDDDQEIIICLAGSPHVGKKSYLAALIQAIRDHAAFENHTASWEQILAVKKYQRFIENIRETLDQVCLGEKKYAAVLVTKSDQILVEGGSNSLFRPDEHAFRDHVREDSSMDFDLVKEFAHKSYAYLDRAHGIVSRLSGSFEDLTSFAIAAYGININPFTDEIPDMPGDKDFDHEDLPSMVELPFLWTAAVLGLIPATKTVDEWVPPKKIGPVTIRSGYYVRYLAQVSRRELFIK